jgi:hypothetical protein
MEQVACTGQMRNPYTLFVKTKMEETIWKAEENNIKINLKETECKGVR